MASVAGARAWTRSRPRSRRPGFGPYHGRRMRILSPLAAVVVIAMAVPAAGCGSDDKPAPGVVAMAGQTVTTAKLQTIAAGICDAARQAGRDIDSARAIFFGQAHDGL